jgi:ornithine carbamoyltransferase
MTLDEIKEAVRGGKVVHWATDAYNVEVHMLKSGEEQWLIHCLPTNHYIGLTHADEVTMNGKPEQFYIEA